MPHDLINAFKAAGEKLGLECVTDESADNCLRFGNIYALISSLVVSTDTQLSDLRDNFISQVESQIKKALEFRQQLPQAMVNDLNVVFVLEPTESNCKTLNDLSNEIERDDRVCRKMVWLKGPYGKSVENFLDRTFLARPWACTSPATADALLPLTDDLGISNDELFDALMDEELDGEEFVRKLMTIMGGNGEQ